MKWLSESSEFVRRIHRQLRFGERSRAPLKLMRLELKEESAECEWVARANDAWDAHLPVEVREENATYQALRDALTIREFLFFSFPEVERATLRVFRQTRSQTSELIISGTVQRQDEPPPRIPSLFMKAKLCGFRFTLSDGVFERLDPEAEERLQVIHK